VPSLGCSEEFFVEHVRPHMRVVASGPQAAVPGGRAEALVDDMTEYAVCAGLRDRWTISI
jgi:hypothetical protein